MNIQKTKIQGKKEYLFLVGMTKSTYYIVRWRQEWCAFIRVQSIEDSKAIWAQHGIQLPSTHTYTGLDLSQFSSSSNSISMLSFAQCADFDAIPDFFYIHTLYSIYQQLYSK